jgi:hypothetical protein
LFTPFAAHICCIPSHLLSASCRPIHPERTHDVMRSLALSTKPLSTMLREIDNLPEARNTTLLQRQEAAASCSCLVHGTISSTLQAQAFEPTNEYHLRLATKLGGYCISPSCKAGLNPTVIRIYTAPSSAVRRGFRHPRLCSHSMRRCLPLLCYACSQCPFNCRRCPALRCHSRRRCIRLLMTE